MTIAAFYFSRTTASILLNFDSVPSG